MRTPASEPGHVAQPDLVPDLPQTVDDRAGEAQPHDVFTLPKMLRAYFRFDRSLLNGLSRAAYDAILTYLRGLMGEGYAPGMIIARQTFGEGARFHPHLHAILTGGGWDASGQWRTVFGWDRPVLRELFQIEVFRFLRERQVIYYGVYANASKRLPRRRAEEGQGGEVGFLMPVEDPTPSMIDTASQVEVRPIGRLNLFQWLVSGREGWIMSWSGHTTTLMGKQNDALEGSEGARPPL